MNLVPPILGDVGRACSLISPILIPTKSWFPVLTVIIIKILFLLS